MLRLAGLSLARPRAALLAWAVAVVALGGIGLGVAHSLSPSIVVVPGTESSRAQQLGNASFGPTQLIPILLEGPVTQLERQGPRLVRALVKRPYTRALSAWDAGSASEGLRPSKTAAMIVVSVDRPERDVVNSDQPQIEKLVASTISRPVRASVTGQPSIDRALKNRALSVALRAELTALAILFVLLVLALRAPLAAALVAVIGAATVLSAYGLMALLGRVIAIDPIAVTLASMTGLALGVGFSLLMLDRAHQQPRPTGARSEVLHAAAAAVASTGRAVLVAGGGLVLALVLATAIAPTSILTSLGIGVVLCAALAIGGAVVVTPAALVLFGDRVLSASFAAPHRLTRGWERVVGTGAWVRRDAAIAGLLATVALVALAVPALSLKTGPPGVSQLPKGNPARSAFEEVARVMGAGWPTPYNLIVVDQHGPITTATTLERLDQLQEDIASDRLVASVTGPGALSGQTKPLGTLPVQLNESGKLLKGGKSDLQRLVNGLGLAGSGARKLQSGLQSATAGAGELHSGSGAAQSGSTKLHAGLSTARAGSAQLASGLAQALSGADALAGGATQALAGSIELTNGLGSAHAPLAAGLPSLKQLAGLATSTSSSLGPLQGEAQSASGQISTALEALRSMGAAAKGDPRYGEALAALERAQGSVGSLSSGLGSAAANAKSVAGLAGSAATQGSFLTVALGELQSGAGRLQAGLAKLRKGNLQLASGINALAGGGERLTAGLTKLSEGAGTLEAGLGQLTSGSGQLESGLAAGVSPTGQLVNGLGVMQKSVAKFRSSLPSPKGLEELQQKSPGLFNSGYFLLAAIEGAPAASSNAAGFAVNVPRGGNAGQIVVISRYGSSAAQTATLGRRLDTTARRFAARNHLEVAVGGPAGNLTDFASATKARLPWVIAALALALAAVLALALRAVALAAVAIVFNLLTAAATFGAIELLFGGAHPLLGGPGYVDPMSLVGIFAAVFGISFVFLAMLLMRTRDELVGGSGGERALEQAMRATAAAGTGAGLVMIAAAIPFAASDLLTVRVFGVGVALAVALDAFLLRPVLMPAAVAVLGPRGWWPTAPPTATSASAPSAPQTQGVPSMSREELLTGEQQGTPMRGPSRPRSFDLSTEEGTGTQREASDPPEFTKETIQ